jgi:hypothetical protein
VPYKPPKEKILNEADLKKMETLNKDLIEEIKVSLLKELVARKNKIIYLNFSLFFLSERRKVFKQKIGT